MIRISPIKKLKAEITVPGSKYVANRVLIIAALADGISAIKNIPENNDINAAIAALKQFNIDIKKEGDCLKIIGSNGKLKAPKEQIDAHDSGTLMRFMTAFASLADGKTTITGSKRIKERPIIELVKSLNDLGIKCTAKNNFPPVTIESIESGKLKGGITKIKGDVSSQFISALLLIAPYAEKDTTIIIESDLVSKNYVDLTIDLMEKFNVNVKRDGYKKFKIKPGQKYIARKFTVPGDWSSANYFLAAAAIIPGNVKINSMDMQSLQGEANFSNMLERMGCTIRKNEASIEITGTKNLLPVNADMSSMPDAAQTLAAVAVFSEGTTEITNIGNLRYKECDRIKETAKELKKLGINAEEKNDSLIIEGNSKKIKKQIKNAIIEPHNDHRMAMSFALIGLKSGIIIANHECAAKSFPNFWDKLKEIGAEIREIKNIALIGYRGAGKTVTASILSKKTGKEAISTDEEIRKSIGKIKEFVEKNGWKQFRGIESSIIKKISKESEENSNKGNKKDKGNKENKRGSIIDCGGGIVEKQENISNLKKHSIIIWLKASTKTIANRIVNNKDMPSLTKNKSFVDEIDEMLAKRLLLYKNASDYIIETDNKSAEQVADEILDINRQTQ